MTGNTRITGDPKVFGLIYFLGAVITSQGGFRTTEVYSLCSEAKSPKLRCGQFVLPWKLPGRTLPCLLQLLAPPGVAQCPVACTRMTAVPASVVPWLLCVSSLCLFPSYKVSSHLGLEPPLSQCGPSSGITSVKTLHRRYWGSGGISMSVWRTQITTQ